MNPIPLSLYVHVPWCVTKCHYCDFRTLTHSPQVDVSAFVHAIKRDLAWANTQVESRPLISVFFGGGTPSLMPASFFAEVTAQARQLWSLAPDVEITMEANPGDVVHYEDYRQAGINRISLGIQSFDDGLLQKLGRRHNSQDSHNSITKACASGMNVSIDLMYGLPQQSLEQWQHTLMTALAYGVQHLSVYQLSIEEKTAFAKSKPSLPADPLLQAMENMTSQLMTDAGFEHYEVSNFCQKNHASRHNLNYWQFGDYVAAGMAAHGKYSNTLTKTIHRYHWPEHYLDYQNCNEPSVVEVKASERSWQYMMNTLRITDPLRFEHYQSHTFLPAENIKNYWQQLAHEKHLETHPQGYLPTALAWRYVNDLVTRLI